MKTMHLVLIAVALVACIASALWTGMGTATADPQKSVLPPIFAKGKVVAFMDVSPGGHISVLETRGSWMHISIDRGKVKGWVHAPTPSNSLVGVGIWVEVTR
ncbi:MAG: hypothetical protein QNJ90_15385 [Planctomycetota bacterium]|nr:hypothetical protein [Planctomycetota bacterium]